MIPPNGVAHWRMAGETAEPAPDCGFDGGGAMAVVAVDEA